MNYEFVPNSYLGGKKRLQIFVVCVPHLVSYECVLYVNFCTQECISMVLFHFEDYRLFFDSVLLEEGDFLLFIQNFT